ncbi:MAG TPA: hypothetical protein DCZ23_00115 [Lachnospiraceae bacterium]|nr:hypothetical protein [Lachnospiraceae bacterium]
MVKAKKRLFILLVCALIAGQASVSFPACAGVQEKQEISEIIQEINQKNRKLDAPDISLKKFCYNFKNNKQKLNKKDISIMWKDYNRKNIKKNIPAVSARKEVKWLFRLLRSQYGLYTYYGGDAKFARAKKAVLKEIGTKGSIKTKKYQKLLHKHLDFITDSHLAIGEELFSPDTRLFSDESVRYIKYNACFYKEGNPGDKILSINGKKPEIYLKRAIDNDGRLAYFPYVMLEQKDNICSYSIQYQSGKTEYITLKPARYVYKKNVKRMYGYEKYDKLAYIEMNQAYMDWETPKERKRFLKDVDDMKKKEQLVFDLRNNTGGDGSLVDEWFKKYTGKTLLPNYSTLRIRPTAISSKRELAEMDEFAASYGLKKSGRYYYYANPGHQYLDNGSRQIFVLTSRMTSSAAEAMTDALKNIENVITIGTNTGGVLINMANYSMAMPYSGLFLQYGSCLQHFDSSYFKESYGIEPDIYLTGKNLKQRLKKFFEIYVTGL